jgi:hypothetical protein
MCASKTFITLGSKTSVYDDNWWFSISDEFGAYPIGFRLNAQFHNGNKAFNVIPLEKLFQLIDNNMDIVQYSQNQKELIIIKDGPMNIWIYQKINQWMLGQSLI